MTSSRWSPPSRRSVVRTIPERSDRCDGLSGGGSRTKTSHRRLPLDRRFVGRLAVGLGIEMNSFPSQSDSVEAISRITALGRGVSSNVLCRRYCRRGSRTRPRYRSSTQPRSPRVRVIHDRNDSALAASDPWPGGGCCQRLNDRKVRSMTTAMTATTPRVSAHNTQPVGHNTEPRGMKSSYAPSRSARRDRDSRSRHVATSEGARRPPCPLYGLGTEMRASRSESGDSAAVISRCLRSMSLRVGAMIHSPTRPKARPTR